MKRWIHLFFILLCYSSFLSAVITDEPWYPEIIKLYGKFDYRCQAYPKVNGKAKSHHYSSTDLFINNRYLAVFDPYSIEATVELADTRKRSFGFDHVGLTGRYLLLDDNIGDPVSLTVGLTLSHAWKVAVKDVSSFHHGTTEAFLHMALGKQQIVQDAWWSRYWTVVGVGTANEWTPWIRVDGFYEKRFCEATSIKFLLKTLWGCGTKRLKVFDFKGYAPIRHQSVDIGVGLNHEFKGGGILKLDYAYRVYALNFPAKANQFVISYTHTFGLKPHYYLLKAIGK